MRSNAHNSPLPPLTLRGGITSVNIHQIPFLGLRRGVTLANVHQMPPLGLRGGWGSYFDQCYYI